MGRKTYEKVLSFGIPWPHAGRKYYVLSKTKTGSDENVEFYNGPVAELIAQLRQKPGLDIYCDGGADVVDELIRQDLINHYTITIIPVLLGDAITP
ncbi:MAG: hypothetical protein OHK0019_15100 [Saprospiraceae bacterium]